MLLRAQFIREKIQKQLMEKLHKFRYTHMTEYYVALKIHSRKIFKDMEKCHDRMLSEKSKLQYSVNVKPIRSEMLCLFLKSLLEYIPLEIPQH